MGYSYMKHHYGDNCFYGDTDYKRYARYHMPREINIFTGGCYSQSTHCCGGGFDIGNFKSAFGLGLGMSLGNMLMGGLNRLGGWLGGGMGLGWGGGFGGFGGGFGMGFPSYGFGGGLGFTGWGGSTGVSSTKKGGSSELKAQSVGLENQTSGNADTSKLKELTDRFIAIKDPNSTKSTGEDTINKLLEELDPLCGKPLDEANKDDDIYLYNNLRNEIYLYNAQCNGKLDETIANSITVKIGDIKIEKLEDLKSVKFSDLSNVTQVDATCILVKLGIIAFDSTSTKAHNGWTSTGDTSTYYLCGKLKDMHPNVLKLLEISEVTTEIYEGQGPNDKWFAGQIQNVQDDENGKLVSFEFSCKATGEDDYRGIYTVTAKENGKYDVTAAENSETKIKSNTGVNMEFDPEKMQLKGTLTAQSK